MRNDEVYRRLARRLAVIDYKLNALLQMGRVELDLEEMQLATNEEILAELEETAQDLQTVSDNILALQQALADAIAAGQTVPQAIQDAINSVGDAAQGLVTASEPNPGTPPPPIEPTPPDQPPA
jgi:hypothetical protein